MDMDQRIEVDPDRMNGKPVIKGTRITVEILLQKMAEGADKADILDVYPQLEGEDIQAALEYAARTLADEERLEPATGT